MPWPTPYILYSTILLLLETFPFLTPLPLRRSVFISPSSTRDSTVSLLCARPSDALCFSRARSPPRSPPRSPAPSRPPPPASCVSSSPCRPAPPRTHPRPSSPRSARVPSPSSSSPFRCRASTAAPAVAQ
ncbi:unnamed protein product [Chondrus crispus]|uniref:Uncharacterized protein n=1 Tax=Chondrus crispus TaxID=2769 RepID=R7Q4B1_CHOCR|nr:unnamed protein product [Chondrus crispus]CDF32310.1 unnamed protein product [Chondrus crispus]|eukprot:XP_005711975.1 unnamed protein product [Chondrus crispus]